MNMAEYEEPHELEIYNMNTGLWTEGAEFLTSRC